jgi:hypothetical protein
VTPIAAAIDSVLQAALGPSLRARGFHRARRTWWRSGDDVLACVSGLAHRDNSGRTGLVTVEIGVSYLALGETPPQPRSAAGCAHWCRIGAISGSGADLWWQIDDADDAADRARVTDRLAQVWQRDGLPLVDALHNPRAYLDVAFSPREHGRALGLAELDLLVRLGERHWAREVLEEQLAVLLSEGRRRPTAAEPHQRAFLPVRYAWLLPHMDELGVPLSSAHEHLVREGWRDAREHPEWGAVPLAGPAAAKLADLRRRLQLS